MAERGKLIVIEGGEGCGKTTHAGHIADWLRLDGKKAMYGREPGGIKRAERIRELLKDSELHYSPEEELFLFLAARAGFVNDVVIPNLEGGTWVVSDRSGISTEAYQGYGGGLDLELIRKLNSIATRGLIPDLTFIIDINAEQGLSKEKEKDRISTKGLEYHLRVNQGFREIAEHYQELHKNCVLVPYIDGGMNIMLDQMKEEIRNRLF